MSQRTHVAGIIRLDSIGAQVVRYMYTGKDNELKNNVHRALGNTWKYSDDVDTIKNCTVPQGSEGSIQYRVDTEYPADEDSHSLSWGFVYIWGDLRDFGTEGISKIENWFKNSLQTLSEPKIDKPIEHMTDRENEAWQDWAIEHNPDKEKR